ncbi:MAG: YHS domain-containing protein [Candidatus Brocadia sp.]|nr:YHS domain-containing protein [Candidatus Brocadia sp.]
MLKKFGYSFVVVSTLIFGVCVVNTVLVGSVIAAGKETEKKDVDKDPVCGMEVNKEKAVKLEHDGKTYYFCSKMCEESFKKDPSKYLKEKEK